MANTMPVMLISTLMDTTNWAPYTTAYVGRRQTRPRRPRAEYQRGRRVEIAVDGRPDDRCRAHHHVGDGQYGAVRAHEPGEQRVGRGPAVVVPEIAPDDVHHRGQVGPLADADDEQRQRARRARDVGERFDRLLVAGAVPEHQRRAHRRRDERPERVYQPRVRGRDPCHETSGQSKIIFEFRGCIFFLGFFYIL